MAEALARFCLQCSLGLYDCDFKDFSLSAREIMLLGNIRTARPVCCSWCGEIEVDEYGSRVGEPQIEDLFLGRSSGGC